MDFPKNAFDFHGELDKFVIKIDRNFNKSGFRLRPKTKKYGSGNTGNKCFGSGSVIYLYGTDQKIKNNLDFYCFVTSL